MKRYKNLFFTLTFMLIFISFDISAQVVRVIDNKGTISSVRNTRVYTVTKPSNANAVEGDIFFDVYPNPTLVEIWDGTSWKVINNISGTQGSIFFADTDETPTENNSDLFWDNTNNRLGVGTNSPTNKLHVSGAIRAQGILNTYGVITEPSYRFFNDTNTGIYRPAADELGFSVGGKEAIRIDETTNKTKVTINETLELNGKLLDYSNDAGTNGQILSSTATGTNWIDNPALNNWLTTGNSGTTNANFLGTTDDKKMEIRSNNIPILEFGRRQTLSLTQSYPDYTDNNQYLVHVKGNNGISALQFLANGASFYKPMFFTTSNGSFRLKGSAGKTDLFEIGSAGPNNEGRLEFIIGDDGAEPIVFKRYIYQGAKFHRELFRVQGSTNSRTAKTRFGINLNQQEVPVSVNLDKNYNDSTFKKANSTFQVEGSVSKSIIRTGSNLTLTEDHHTVIATNTSIWTTKTISLPDPTDGITGRIYIIKTNSSRKVNLNRTYIKSDGSTSPTSIPAGKVVQLQSDGTDWQQIN